MLRISGKKVTMEVFQIGKRLFGSCGFSSRLNRCVDRRVWSIKSRIQVVMKDVITDIRVNTLTMGLGV